MKIKDKKYTYICLFILILILVLFTFFHTIEFFTPVRMPIYIISLPKHYDERLVPLLSNIKEDPQYSIDEIYASDGNLIQLNNGKFESLNKGQIGCFESHLYFWKKMNNDYALVLEDDALIQMPSMFNYIQQIIDSHLEDWSVIFIGGRVAYPHTCDMNTVVDIDNISVIKPNCTIWHTHAYLISETGCKQLINKFNNSEKIRSPVDNWMTEDDVDGVYICIPEIIPFRYDGISDT